MTKIANEEDLYRITIYAPTKYHRAIVHLLSSSGMPNKFIEELTFKQLLSACDSYFKFGENKTINNLIKKDPVKDNYIPCFDFKDDNKPRIACCSPKALKVIFQYIHYRKNIKMDEPYIFLNSENDPIIDKDAITTIIRKARKNVNKFAIDGTSNITANQIRARFWHIAENNMHGIYKDEVLMLMKGNSSRKNKNFYDYICNDKQVLINHYKTIVDFLAIRSEDDKPKTQTRSYTSDFTY